MTAKPQAVLFSFVGYGNCAAGFENSGLISHICLHSMRSGLESLSVSYIPAHSGLNLHSALVPERLYYLILFSRCSEFLSLELVPTAHAFNTSSSRFQKLRDSSLSFQKPQGLECSP